LFLYTRIGKISERSASEAAVNKKSESQFLTNLEGKGVIFSADTLIHNRNLKLPTNTEAKTF
jgi:hypothetical protein